METTALSPRLGNLQLGLCLSGRSEAKETWLARILLRRWARTLLFPVIEKEKEKNKIFPRWRV